MAVPYRGKDDSRVVIEGIREKLGEPIDYRTLVVMKLQMALALPLGGTKRQAELNDLEDLLSPFIQGSRACGRKKDLNYDIALKKLEGEERNWNGKGHWNDAYQRGRLRLLMDLMKENDMLTIGKI